MSKVRSHTRKSGAERRQEILDVTLRLISEHGVEGATVSRIAAAVELTPGALYRHFESRAALISAANKVANERALGWVETSGEPNVLKRLQELGDAHLAWAKENLATVVRPFFLELASAPMADPATRLTITHFKSFSSLVDMVEEGKAQGTIRSDVRPEDVAWALHMFAWAEDIALLGGAEDSILEGVLARNLTRLLDSFRPTVPSGPDDPVDLANPTEDR